MIANKTFTVVGLYFDITFLQKFLNGRIICLNLRNVKSKFLPEGVMLNLPSLLLTLPLKGLYHVHIHLVTVYGFTHCLNYFCPFVS